MKKLSPEQRLYYLRIAEKRERKVQRKNRQKRWKRKSPKSGRQYLLMEAPSRISVTEERARVFLLRFLTDLRQAATRGGRITICFKDTEAMVSSGALLLKAEIHRLIRLFPSTQFRCLPPKSNRIKQVLSQIEIFKLLKCKCELPLTREDVIHWKTAHGNLVEGEKFDLILGAYDGALAEPVSAGLYSGITEAMANSVDHAYIMPRKDGLDISSNVNDWWMFSQKKDGKLNVVFCDLGVGIPATISHTRPDMWDRIKRFVNLSSDSEVIHFATGSGKSRTGKGYRGKGLPQLVAEIRKIRGGVLWIMSNYGTLLTTADGDQRIDHKTSILGTVLAWEVPLSEDRG